MRVHTLCVLFMVVVQMTVASPVDPTKRNEPPCGPTDNFFAAGPDCASFYECRFGRVDTLPCPDGHYWNTDVDRCLLDVDGICGEDGVTVTPEITEPPPTTEPTTTPAVTANPNPTASPPQNTWMPDVEGALPVLFPGTDCPEGERAFAVHELDCRRFYYCLYGVRYAQTCPFLQKFDVLRGHCVPENDEELFCYMDLD